MRFISKICAFTLLGLAATISTARGIFNALQASQDFQWSPARLLFVGKNPYEVWLHGNTGGDIILSQAPNYLHYLYFALFPLGVMDFATAKLVWALLNVILAVCLTVILTRYWFLTRTAGYILLGLFLCSTPFRNGLGNGQHALFVMIFLILPFIGLRGGHALQGLGYGKYSFSPPFFLYNFFHHGSVKTALGLLFPILGLVGFCVWTGTSPASALFQPLMVASTAVGQGTADAMSVMETLFGVSTIVAGTVSLFLATGLSFLVARHPETDRHLPLLALVSLITFKHLNYDFVFLLPLLAYSLTLERQELRLLVWAGIGWFWFGQKMLWYMLYVFSFDYNQMKAPLLYVNFGILMAMIILLLQHRPVREGYRRK